MADTKYLSKIVKDGNTIYMKDSEARDALLYPVDVSSITPSSTFAKNSIIGINGVLYRATAATSNLPVTLEVSDSAFVVNTINNKIAFVVTDYTLNSDWEVWTDAAIEYWQAALDTRISAIENLSVTYDGVTYTLDELLAGMAQLMAKKVVVKA